MTQTQPDGWGDALPETAADIEFDRAYHLSRDKYAGRIVYVVIDCDGEIIRYTGTWSGFRIGRDNSPQISVKPLNHLLTDFDASWVDEDDCYIDPKNALEAIKKYCPDEANIFEDDVFCAQLASIVKHSALQSSDEFWADEHATFF